MSVAPLLEGVRQPEVVANSRVTIAAAWLAYDQSASSDARRLRRMAKRLEDAAHSQFNASSSPRMSSSNARRSGCSPTTEAD
jgi:hypothetical protein